MCGRYRLKEARLSKLAERFGLSGAAAELSPRLNIRPTEAAPVVVLNGRERALELMRWGLVPSWAKDAKDGAKRINARAETIDELASFKEPFRTRRCLVVTDGFYEWKDRRPWLIARPDGEPFALAGLWSPWKDLRTFTIVTVDANPRLKTLHDRMPVVLARESEAAWLEPAASPDALKALLSPSTEELSLSPAPSLPAAPGA